MKRNKVALFSLLERSLLPFCSVSLEKELSFNYQGNFILKRALLSPCFFASNLTHPAAQRNFSLAAIFTSLCSGPSRSKHFARRKSSSSSRAAINYFFFLLPLALSCSTKLSSTWQSLMLRKAKIAQIKATDEFETFSRSACIASHRRDDELKAKNFSR
jgi:hypothetical protein